MIWLLWMHTTKLSKNHEATCLLYLGQEVSCIIRYIPTSLASPYYIPVVLSLVLTSISPDIVNCSPDRTAKNTWLRTLGINLLSVMQYECVCECARTLARVICVGMVTYVQMPRYMCVYSCGGQRSASRVIPQDLSTYVLKHLPLGPGTCRFC